MKRKNKAEQARSPLEREKFEERQYRNKLLSDSDWTQLADAPLTKAKIKLWADYRVLLRDVTEQPGFPFDVVYPEEPK
jgi:hypothetical protein